MNKLITLGVISLVCMVAMATAFFGPTGGAGYQGYAPMYYGAGGTGAMGGSFFSIIIFLIIISFLGKGNLFGGGRRF